MALPHTAALSEAEAAWVNARRISQGLAPLPQHQATLDQEQARRRGQGRGQGQGVGSGRRQRDGSDDDDGSDDGDERGETIDEWVTRRTGEWNRLLSAQPQNEMAWLKFVAFQDEVHRMQRNKNKGAVREL
jgi:hypothetical protein